MSKKVAEKDVYKRQQLVEQLTLNQWAQGSSPWRCTRKATQ